MILGIYICSNGQIPRYNNRPTWGKAYDNPGIFVISIVPKVVNNNLKHDVENKATFEHKYYVAPHCSWITA